MHKTEHKQTLQQCGTSARKKKSSLKPPKFHGYAVFKVSGIGSRVCERRRNDKPGDAFVRELERMEKSTDRRKSGFCRACIPR